MMAMNCLVARGVIESTAGGTLEAADCGVPEAALSDAFAHASSCETCTDLIDEFARASAALTAAFRADRVAEVRADEALVAAVDARLPRGRVRALPWTRWASKAAVVLVAVGIGFAVHRSRGALPPVTRETYRLCPPRVDGYDGPRFDDVTVAAGIANVDHTGLAGRKDWMVETVGHGAAVFDMDADGDLDLFVPDGNRLDPTQQVTGTWRLYRNDGAMRFTDVTADSGLDVDSWGSGAVAGDVDGDGLPDIY
ncbi:MAG: VCBS repeat-containing protein, partial [Planctomycetes bacterium]|nr:VCBS repeat-containing protein [Planctomycetota bacterium]